MKQEQQSDSGIVTSDLRPTLSSRIKKAVPVAKKPKQGGPIDKDQVNDSKKRKFLLIALAAAGIAGLGFLVFVTFFNDKEPPRPKTQAILQLEGVNLEGVEPRLAAQHLLALGAAYETGGFKKEAEDTYKKALNLVSGDDRKDALLALFKFYKLNENSGEAKKIAKELIVILEKKDNAFTYSEIAELARFLGDEAKAQEYESKYNAVIKELSKNNKPGSQQEEPN